MELEHVPNVQEGANSHWMKLDGWNSNSPTRNTFGDAGAGILRRPKRITRNQIGDDTSISSDTNFTRIELR